MQDGATSRLQPSPLLGPAGPALSREVAWRLSFLEVGPEWLALLCLSLCYWSPLPASLSQVSTPPELLSASPIEET